MEKLTLDEAIKHAKEVAEKNYRGAKFESVDSIDNDIKANCVKCAKEHEQLAKWLEELKSYKDLEERLHKIFGEESTFSLTDVIDTLEMELSEPDKKHPVNARILTYEEANKWQEYKELEEQGLFVRLPCKVGDDIYVIPSQSVYGINIVNGFEKFNRVYHQHIGSITFFDNRWYATSREEYGIYNEKVLNDIDYGITWFTDYEEAEKKLEEMKNG